jgi:hypothetical protein
MFVQTLVGAGVGVVLRVHVALSTGLMLLDVAFPASLVWSSSWIVTAIAFEVSRPLGAYNVLVTSAFFLSLPVPDRMGGIRLTQGRATRPIRYAFIRRKVLAKWYL